MSSAYRVMVTFSIGASSPSSITPSLSTSSVTVPLQLPSRTKPKSTVILPLSSAALSASSLLTPPMTKPPVSSAAVVSPLAVKVNKPLVCTFPTDVAIFESFAVLLLSSTV